MSRTRTAYDRWAPDYDSDPNPQTVLEQESVVSMVAPGRDDAILDAACGTGRYCRIFQDEGASVTGIDFSEGMLAVARAVLPDVDLSCVDLMGPLPFPDATFDKVNCAQALKHLPELHEPLREFARVVKPTGTVTFSVTHPEMDWEGYELRASPSFVLSKEADIHHHSFWQYFEAIDRAGLRMSAFRQVPVDERIREYLVPASFDIVKGRFQIAVFQAIRPRLPGRASLTIRP